MFFRKKQVVIEAVQWTGQNLREVLEFTGKHDRWNEWFEDWKHYEQHVKNNSDTFKIFTLEGVMTASPGDWIIKGIKGEFYPCKPDIFVETYETVSGPDEAAFSDLGPILDLLPDAIAAANKAMRKYPQPNYTISKWAEETGEVTKALIHAAENRESWDNVRGEMIQALAMLHRILVEGDQVHGLPPVAAEIVSKTGEEETPTNDWRSHTLKTESGYNG